MINGWNVLAQKEEYRRPAHTDFYMQWDSHNNLAARFSVINNLINRAKTVCCNPKLLKEEGGHFNQALQKCKDHV